MYTDAFNKIAEEDRKFMDDVDSEDEDDFPQFGDSTSSYEEVSMYCLPVQVLKLNGTGLSPEFPNLFDPRPPCLDTEDSATPKHSSLP